MIAAEIDDLADLARLEAEGDLRELRRERLIIDPTPITAQVAGAIFRIHLRHFVEIRAGDEFGANFIRH